MEAAKDIAPLEPLKTYDLPTPYNNFGVGALLKRWSLRFSLSLYEDGVSGRSPSQPIPGKAGNPNGDCNLAKFKR
ncbi:MAG: hypothetical protein F6K30_07570 [Cyanothece sp. SIO2G6]|nr:hypothetical protein [Cyanothece sp. SIO2G6]